MIVFLSGLSVFLSSVIALSVFKNIKTDEQIKKIILNSTKLFSIFFSLMLIFLLVLGKLRGLSFHLSAPIYFIILLTFKYYFDNFLPISNKFNYFLQLIIIIFFTISVFASNKTSLVAFLVSLFIYLLINRREKLKYKTFDLITKGKMKFILVPIAVAMLIFLAVKLGLVALIIDKITKTIEGFSSNGGINSLYIRKNNWKYFIHYWQYHLNILETIFGFGLGKSREVIFYISAAQYNFIYRVQTVHNQFMEMFFDYGLMALFYYVPIITIFIKNVKNIFINNVCKEIKLFSNMSLLLIVFYIIYHLADGLRVTTAIIFFSILIFIEGLNFSLKNLNINKDLNTNKDLQ